MSAAAEGIAGLALSAVSIATLFTACIECFNIVIAAQEFSEDYEQLCILFSLQRTRFGLWGESVGLISNPEGRTLPYNKNLDRPDVRTGLERTLCNIKLLLQKAGEVDERYQLATGVSEGTELVSSIGLNVFKASFERFKSRLRKNQAQKSVWKVTRWAIHDAPRFEAIIARLKDYVDGLESITASLGLLADQHARLRNEIDHLSDVESLRLLRDASSSEQGSSLDVSDTASRRLISVVATSILERGSTYTGPGTEGTNESFHTANESYNGQPGSSLARSLQNSKATELSKMETLAEDPGMPEVNAMSAASSQALEPFQIPQNQRVLADLIGKVQAKKDMSFAAGDANYGNKLAAIKKMDEQIWQRSSPAMVWQADSGSSHAKRMFIELRNIRTGKVPFISAAPVNDRLDNILASIEGPPETPYEGGVFWLTVTISKIDPHGIPLIKFHTRVYHPNIDCHGNICADYSSKWALTSGTNDWRFGDPSIIWTLGGLLVAICGLLSSPVLEDPLVPEIAQKYVEDNDGYCEAARLYTKRYASSERPTDDSLVFVDDEKPTALPEYTARNRTSSTTRAKSIIFEPGKFLEDEYKMESDLHYPASKDKSIYNMVLSKNGRATRDDARKYNIPQTFSLHHWNPTKEPILFLGEVFDSDSLGEWIYTEDLSHPEYQGSVGSIAKELRLILSEFGGKTECAEKIMPIFRSRDDREIIEKFIELGRKLTARLKELLMMCEEAMRKMMELRSNEEKSAMVVVKVFRDMMFSEGGVLKNDMEKFMGELKMWNQEFHDHCEDYYMHFEDVIYRINI